MNDTEPDDDVDDDEETVCMFCEGEPSFRIEANVHVLEPLIEVNMQVGEAFESVVYACEACTLEHGRKLGIKIEELLQ